jgi:hypothetical protein
VEEVLSGILELAGLRLNRRKDPLYAWRNKLENNIFRFIEENQEAREHT